MPARPPLGTKGIGSEQPSNADREFLFTYRFGGSEWGTSVFADSPAEAKEKVKAMSLARYDGELEMRIPAIVPGAGLFVRFWCWLKNKD